MHLPHPDLYVILHWRLDGNRLCDVAYNDAVYASKIQDMRGKNAFIWVLYWLYIIWFSNITQASAVFPEHLHDCKCDIDFTQVQ